MRTLSVAFLVSICVACGGAGQAPESGTAPTPEIRQEALEQARQAADALTGQLMQTLIKELAAGEPAQAVKVCSELAPQIAADHSEEGVTIRRVSLKFRNPADAPDDFERAKLEELEALHAKGQLPDEMSEVVNDGVPSLRYLRPIVVKGPCLKCHGVSEAIDPEVRAILDERYPDDLAVGYAVGDLRGAVSVVVDLAVTGH